MEDRRNDMRIRKLEKQLIIMWALFGILAIGSIAGLIGAYRNRVKGTPLDTMAIVDQKLNFKADHNLTKAIEENYMAYLHKAYILYGKYPDFEYYKISANVARNDYSWKDDFYVAEGKLYYNYYKDGEMLGKPGIDVSEFQKDIDWNRVRATGMKVAIIRIGYRGYGTGKINADSKFIQNIIQAKKAGMEVGVYFFSAAINEEEGIEEAKFTLDLLNQANAQYQAAIENKGDEEASSNQNESDDQSGEVDKTGGPLLDYPVVFDTELIFEDDTARTNNISIEDRTAATVGFCKTIKDAGYTPMIYASQDQFIKYLNIDAIGDYEFWLAAYDTPFFPYHAEAYQYSPSGYVDGISTQVDLDVWMR